NVPWAILMDPTSACNLKCTGCWAAEYGNQLSMSYDTLNDIILQGKEMGTYMYIYSGGEPLVRKKDIIALCREHQDCMFLAFTNGTLIDEAFADEMLEVKNFVPAISIEGFEEETDDRRGAGTYQSVIRAMEILKERKLIFGASCCYTSKNTNVIGSEEFFDDLIARGSKFAWFFTYMPVGVGAPTDLIVSAQQREFMYNQIRAFRKTKPLFTMDFWNDGEYSKGCIAGGRSYLHINANGDIEPCAFIHYSDSSIYEKTLLEAYTSPLFMQYRQNQPFNENHLRPCPLLDNNGKLAQMVHESNAHSTDMSQLEDVDELCAKCKMAAQNWQPVADRIWEETQAQKPDVAENKTFKYGQQAG
ncbi:radical SAM protein, partial [Eubacteriales bacterium OttesenSCG-928-K08]|nr:radical SAM protein [Eubacteriales bacterium OttesenSCG-928-K08]